MSETTEEPTAAELLSIYLRDHRAGAASGLALVRRCRRQEPSGELASTLAWLEDQIQDDRRSLDELMAGLSVSPNPLKAALGVAAERAGRLKLNGRVWRRSPLSTLLELEALAGAIFTKRNLWRSLAAVAERSAVGDHRQLTELIARSDAQLERVLAAHDAEARRIFDAAATSGSGDGPTATTTVAPAAAATSPAPVPAPVAAGDAFDQVLEDAEGGIEGSLLDAPDEAAPPA
jgi:hypothetical protein